VAENKSLNRLAAVLQAVEESGCDQALALREEALALRAQLCGAQEEAERLLQAILWKVDDRLLQRLQEIRFSYREDAPEAAAQLREEAARCFGQLKTAYFRRNAGKVLGDLVMEIASYRRGEQETSGTDEPPGPGGRP
jgi:hypothetical protein